MCPDVSSGEAGFGGESREQGEGWLGVQPVARRAAWTNSWLLASASTRSSRYLAI